MKSRNEKTLVIVVPCYMHDGLDRVPIDIAYLNSRNPTFLSCQVSHREDADPELALAIKVRELMGVPNDHRYFPHHPMHLTPLIYRGQQVIELVVFVSEEYKNLSAGKNLQWLAWKETARKLTRLIDLAVLCRVSPFLLIYGASYARLHWKNP